VRAFQGEKLWTFLPPSDTADVALGAYRKAPNAWGGGVDVAAGWESSVDLYRHKKKGSSTSSHAVFTPSAPLPAALQASALRCTQREGDLLLIPPATWHQTYHVGPTLAVAGQFCSSRNARGIFAHILAWCDVADADAGALLSAEGFWARPREAQVQAVLRAALRARHGEAEGDALLAQLLASEEEDVEEEEEEEEEALPRRAPPGPRRRRVLTRRGRAKAAAAADAS
jgi:hypothetical protein